MVNLYQKLGVALPGKVAVKVHSGEQGNQNYLTPEFWKPMEEHGWTKFFDVDIMDAEGPDVVWPVEGGRQLKENHLDKNILNGTVKNLAHFPTVP